MSEGRDLLCRLARQDERLLQTVLLPTPEGRGGAASPGSSLDRRTRFLVRLAALLAVDACAESLCWAVELAATNGADDEAVAAVLIAAGCAAGSAQLVASAPRLALALGFEPVDGTLSY